MLSSIDASIKNSDNSKEMSSLISPTSKKLFLRKVSKIPQKAFKKKKIGAKIEAETLQSKKPSLKKNQSTKLSSILTSPKLTSRKFQINNQGQRSKKTSPRLLATSSNSSLKYSLSPKSSYLASDDVDFPLKPIKALTLYKSELTAYEQGEILKYNQIYYLGTLNNKMAPRIECVNFGFDDSHADYLLIKKDHIAYRYEILNLLGKGSFGQVCECFDHKKKEKVALKIIKNKQKFHLQAKVEVRVLQTIKENDPENTQNIIRMKNFFSFRNHVCITFELISVNLFEFLRLNRFQGISCSLIRCFAKQLLVSLNYIRNLDIVHCDLKPENILIVNPKKAAIKLIDFGSACFVNERLHTYIQSRFYRAPEIILGIPYTTAIDMWSLGCILVELYTGQPLWPGESELDQLLYIISCIGMPTPEVILTACRKSLFFDGDLLKTNKLLCGKTISPGGTSIQEVLIGANPDFVNFIQKCFEWNPSKRMKPGEGLHHPWIRSHKPSNKSEIITKKLTL